MHESTQFSLCCAINVDIIIISLRDDELSSNKKLFHFPFSGCPTFRVRQNEKSISTHIRIIFVLHEI